MKMAMIKSKSDTKSIKLIMINDITFQKLSESLVRQKKSLAQTIISMY